MRKTIKMTFVFIVAAIATMALYLPEAFAARRGGAGMSGDSYLQFGLGLTTATQNDLNSVIDSINTTNGGLTTSKLSSAYEFSATYGFRFSGSMFGLLFRPSYFTQSSTGTCTSGGNCDFSLSGFTIFPMLRLTPLENNFIKFFLQAGIGYGSLTTKITQNTNSMQFSGSEFGTTAGLGADFCFTATHCLTIEGNVRYLPIVRNTGSVTGTVNAGGVITQPTAGGANQEVEINSNDLGTTFSGIQGVLAYTLNF